MTELWESFIDSDPVHWWGTERGVTELDQWHEQSAGTALRTAVVALAEAVDEARCTRDPGPTRGVRPHPVGFWLDESDSDDGVGPARIAWNPTLVRVLDIHGRRVEVLCDGCVNDEIAAADAQRRCVSCWRGHHQGCGAEYTDSEGASQWCQCACRPPAWRVDPPEWKASTA